MIDKILPKQLQDYYSVSQESRYELLLNNFQKKYGKKADFVARAPGRVNIIGEHIDYEGYGVLPAAIQKDCLIAVKRVDTNTISISHCLSEIFPDCQITKYPSKVWEVVPHSYIKYFVAGYRAGVLDLIDEDKLVGLQIMIEGNIPWAAGISSSSAFCVCSALVGSYANNIQIISKAELVERCIKFEREVGTASGGMDQSISLLGKKNCCMYIQFNPIRTEKVEVPLNGFKLVIMNSLVESAKMDTAIYRYNKRVCQCRIATHLLAKYLGVKKQVYASFKILKQLQQHLKLSLSEIIDELKKKLPRKIYSKQEIQNQLEVSLLSIVSDIQRAKQVLEFNKQFKIYEAALHVYSESNRVLEFIKVCKSQRVPQEKAKLLGQLMNQSQYSCRDLYQCSCPQIEVLTELARKNGALGSRLTGAGWGGCTVSIIPESIEASFIAKMSQQYYNKAEFKQIPGFKIQNAVFSTEPSEGAFILSLN